MLRIRRFGVVQTATTVAVFSALFVLIGFLVLGLFFLLLGSAVSIPGNIPGGGAGVVAGGFVGLLVAGGIAAIIYAIVGFIATAIGCIVYNLVAGWTGGIELQIDQVVPPPAPPDWGARPPSGTTPAPPSPTDSR